MEKFGIYIHIPYCASKCIYCDFFSGGIKSARWDAYVSALLNEFRERRGELEGIPTTLYIGGGTPSLVPGKQFLSLIDGIREISGKNDKWDEMTIEVNPEDVSEENCRLWRECGVNRVSMGVQTFVNDELSAIRRRHDAEKASNAINILKNFFDNVSIDLMFGLPGQTVESFCYSVEKALSFKPQHISGYSLMLEPGTPLTLLHEKGIVSLPDEEICLKFFSILSSRLKQAGYIQYEISNYSIPGYESVHNRNYWLGTPYIGLGPAAHSYDGSVNRRANPWDINGYLSRFNYTNCDEMDKQPFYDEEKLTSKELLEEKIMLSLRMKDGLDLKKLSKDFGVSCVNMLLRRAGKHIFDGKLELNNNRLCLSRDGIMISDKIIVDLLP